MAACVGFQDFEGGLMPKMYNDRTLCYFHENDDRAKSRGLCYNSYMDGLSYSEFCYHTKAGRAGLITQVVKTSETGYAQRKLIKTMEDVMIKYDGTVRIANNQIIQQTYGGNGNDTTRQYEYKIGMIDMNNETLENTFKLTKDELKEFSDFTSQDNDVFYQNIKNMRDEMRKNTIKSKLSYMTMGNAFMLSVNVSRIISSTLATAHINEKKKISPMYIINAIENLLSLKETPLIKIPHSLKDDPPKYAIMDEAVAKYTLRTALYDSLHPKAINE